MQKNTKIPHPKNYLKLLYLISFIEGGVVMVTEIAGAKILTPFFGSSLYSWGGTLSITLLALMSGYYFGGYVTTKNNFFSSSKILWAFIVSGLIVFLMPTMGSYIMHSTIEMPFFPGLIVSLLIFLFPPIFLMGMISPMIIFQITEKVSQSGRSAGNIYAVSTFGGILFTLLFSFWVVPNYGISLPVQITGGAVVLIGFLLLVVQRKASIKKPVVIVVALLAGTLLLNSKITKKPTNKPTTKILEHSEGLLGGLTVMDVRMRAPNGTPFYARQLKINNIIQNSVIANSPTLSLLYYVPFAKELLLAMPRMESALLVGLGAGSMYSILRNQNMEVQSVEIDKRIYEYGVEYFDMPAHDVAITDGRYYINVTDDMYDLVVLDVIIGENVPGQLVSLECFQQVYNILSEDGVLIIEHGGLSEMQENLLIPSMVKTLNSAGFQVKLYNPMRSFHYGDILFVATKNELELLYPSFPPGFLDGGNFSSYEVPLTIFNNEDAVLITDNKNNADFMLRSHYLRIRENFRENYHFVH